MSGVNELIQQSIQHREAGQLSAAYASAWSATELEPDSANAWWQLALVTRAQKDENEERDALRMVTALAPEFVDGWCQFALLELRLKDYESALGYFRKALEQDSEHVVSLRGMVLCMDQCFEELHENNEYVQALQRLVDLGVADKKERFRLGFVYGERGDSLAAAHVYERIEGLLEDSASLQNLGVMYRRMGRSADALDALRLSFKLDPDHSPVEKALNTVKGARGMVREVLRLKKEPILSQSDWYRHYVNPFELLDISPAEVQGNAKALQKAKQAVLRELELEDNTVAWMPGLHIDRSSVLSLLEELNDPACFAAHEYVALHPELLAFLSRGELKHFMNDPPDVEDIQLQALIPSELVAPLSLKFAAQFDDVLTRAIELKDPASVDVLLSGRRWVLPDHAERCLEGATRALLRLAEPLDKFCKQAADGDFKPDAVLSWLNTSPLAKLLPKLTLDFIKVHEHFYHGMRSLSIAHYNKTQDAETALALLERARICADMASGLRHQFDEDKNTLEEHLAELKKFDVGLSFGDKNFSMTRQSVVFGSQTLPCKDIESMRWGIERTGVAPGVWRLVVAFGNGRGSDITVSWTATDANFAKQKELWGKIVQGAVNYCFEHAMASFKRKLKNGLGIPVGAALVRDVGVEFDVKGLIFTRRHFAPWAQLHASIENGAIVLRDRTDKKATIELPMATTDNAVLVHMLCTSKEN